MATDFSYPDAAAKASNLPKEFDPEKMSLSMGPSHPSTHGVLRIQFELDGEIVTKADPIVGYLHRGDEKIAENMTYNQFVPYTDRLDYLARHRLEELTPRTISDRTALLTQLEQTPGWAIDREEYAIGATCVAVPVIAPGVTASLAVSLPADQAVVNRRLVSNLQRAARRLSVQLGADALDTDGPDAEFTI